MSYQYGFSEFAEAELSRAQIALVSSQPSDVKVLTEGGLFNDTPSIDCLCQDGKGWGPFYKDISLTPCFVDGVILILPSLLLLTLGFYQILVLSKRKPIQAKKDWKLYSKLVSATNNSSRYIRLLTNGGL